MSDFARFLDRTVTLQRAPAATDSAGGVTRTFAAVSTFKAMISPTSSMVREEYAQRSMIVNYTVTGKTDFGAKVGDRIVDGTSDYLVHGYRKIENALLSLSHYAADCELQPT